MSSFIWSIMGMIAALMFLGGVFLSYTYMHSPQVTEQGFTISNFITSPGFGMIVLGLVMYSVSGRARKKIKKERAEKW